MNVFFIRLLETEFCALKEITVLGKVKTLAMKKKHQKNYFPL